MKLTAVVGGVLSLIVAFYLVNWLGRKTVESQQTEQKPVDPAKDHYTENPFSKPGAGPAPKVEIAETEFDFGITKVRPEAIKGASGSHDFVIKNVGDAPLKLAKGPTQCKCTLSTLDKVELAPGESTTISLEWKPIYVEDPFLKEATIWTNDPALWGKDQPGDGKLLLRIRGKAVDGVEVEPDLFSVGTLNEQAATPLDAKIYSRVMDNLEVAVKSTTSRFLTAAVAPMTPEELKPLEARSGWKLTGAIEPKVSIGSLRESITLTTNDDTRPEVTVSVEGTRQGPFSIAGKYFMASKVLVDFNEFDAAQGISTTLNLYAAHGERPMEVELASEPPSDFKVEISLDTDFPEPDRSRHLIKIEVPPGLPPQRRKGDETARILFRTSSPEVPEFKIHVQYESR
jgi:hypothetical protein